MSCSGASSNGVASIPEFMMSTPARRCASASNSRLRARRTGELTAFGRRADEECPHSVEYVVKIEGGILPRSSLRFAGCHIERLPVWVGAISLWLSPVTTAVASVKLAHKQANPKDGKCNVEQEAEHHDGNHGGQAIKERGEYNLHPCAQHRCRRSACKLRRR